MSAVAESLPSIALQLSECGAVFTPLGLALPESLEEIEWADLGRKLLRSDQVMQWWIGDWAVFGAGNPAKDGWRKKGVLKEFCQANGFDYGNVRNKSWVSASVHLSLRRDTLPWSYFQEIAPLKPKEQIRWLKKAEARELRVADLRKEIRRSFAEENGFDSDGPEIKLPCKNISEAMDWLKSQPDSFWIQEHRLEWCQILKPVVDFYYFISQ